jgi:DNA-binding SARP family transcriptional activator/Tfp pilus assembly protein PilF
MTRPYKIELLGGFRALAPDGAELQLRSRKDQALLAFIALSKQTACSRDALTGALWSTRGEDQARASLRQALWTIKKALGPGADEVLTVDRRTVALREGALDTDVAQFERHLKDGSLNALRAATKLYAGDLLEGVTVRDPAWEEWLLPHRERLRTAMTNALARLASLLIEQNDASGAVQAATRLLAMDPLHEGGHRTLMQAYLLDDERGMALRQYETCREALQRELGVTPSAETETLRRHLTMPVFDAAPGVRDGPSTKPSLVVVPFAGQSGDPDEASMAAGLTESVIAALTRFRDLFVIGYKTAALADRDAVEFGARLGVQYAMEGSVRRAGGRFRITTQLVNVTDGERLWGERFDRESDDLLAIEDELCALIVTTLVGRIEAATRNRAARKRPGDVAVHEHVLLGRDCLNRYTRTGEYEARAHFERALELEPGYPPAVAGLAVSYVHEYESTWTEDPEAALAKAHELGRKAVELDESEGMAHYALGGAYYYRKEYELANLQIERGVQANPLDYHLLCSKGWFLIFSGHRAEGQACLADAMCSVPLTPDNCLFSTGVAEFIAERYEDALIAFGRMSTNSLFKLGWLAACYAQLDRMEEAKAVSRDFLDLAAVEFPPDRGPELPRWQRFWSNQLCFQDDAQRERFFSALRAAGLPV